MLDNNLNPINEGNFVDTILGASFEASIIKNIINDYSGFSVENIQELHYKSLLNMMNDKESDKYFLLISNGEGSYELKSVSSLNLTSNHKNIYLNCSVIQEFNVSKNKVEVLDKHSAKEEHLILNAESFFNENSYLVKFKNKTTNFTIKNILAYNQLSSFVQEN